MGRNSRGSLETFWYQLINTSIEELLNMQCVFITFITNLEERFTIEFYASCRFYSFKNKLPKDFGLPERFHWLFFVDELKFFNLKQCYCIFKCLITIIIIIDLDGTDWRVARIFGWTFLCFLNIIITCVAIECVSSLLTV